MNTLDTIQPTPERFVPDEVFSYLGNVSTAPDARIKQAPEDFIVEELPNQGPLCTIGTDTDLTEPLGDCSLSKRMLTAVTVVKSRMTTFTVRERLADLFKIPASQITYAGLKDAMHTAQLFVISGVPYEDVVRECCPEPLCRRASFFIKDARPVDFTLEKGNLKGNRFTIRVRVPGMSAQEIEQYIKPLLAHLASNNNLFPNAYGRQRLGRRQNLLSIGETLLNDPQEAIKRFLTETSPNETEDATALRESLAGAWQKAEEAAAASGDPIAQQHFWFDAMRCDLSEKVMKGGEPKPKHEAFNMTIEYQIVCSTLRFMDFDLVMADLRDEFSLWIGAYQGFWFNQVLAKVIRGEIKLGYNGKNRRPYKGRRNNPRDQFESGGAPVPSIPLFMQEPKALNFYQRNCPQAIPSQVHPVVERLFLTQPCTVVELQRCNATAAEMRRELARMLRIKPHLIVDVGSSSDSAGITEELVLIRGCSVEQLSVREIQLREEAERRGRSGWGLLSTRQSSEALATVNSTKPSLVVTKAHPVRFDLGHERDSKIFKVENVSCPDSSVELLNRVKALLTELARSSRLLPYNGPWRKAFVPIKDLQCEVEEEAVVLQFLLRSGAYATTILGIIFNLEGDDRVVSEDRILA